MTVVMSILSPFLTAFDEVIQESDHLDGEGRASRPVRPVSIEFPHADLPSRAARAGGICEKQAPAHVDPFPVRPGIDNVVKARDIGLDEALAYKFSVRKGVGAV